MNNHENIPLFYIKFVEIDKKLIIIDFSLLVEQIQYFIKSLSEP